MKGAPATRRAYLDRTVGRLLPARATLANDYAAASGQRNAGLRRVRGGLLDARSAHAVDDARGLARRGARPRAGRGASSCLRRRSPRTPASSASLSATLGYEGEPPTAVELEARLELDLERGVTGAGPHLHDVRIEAGDRDLRSFGSQGEQRMAVLALVLAEADALRRAARRRHRSSCSTTCSPSSTATVALLSGTMLELGSQTVVTATAAAALPVEPAQALSVTPGSGAVMERLGDEVERELARGGSRDAIPLAALTAAWPEIVGDAIASHAWPLRVARDGTLHVATASSTWANELALLADEILERLRDRLGTEAPAKLRFAVGPMPEPAELDEAATASRSRPSTTCRPRCAAEAAAAASAIDDPELRELVARAARASLLQGPVRPPF